MRTMGLNVSNHDVPGAQGEISGKTSKDDDPPEDLHLAVLRPEPSSPDEAAGRSAWRRDLEDLYAQLRTLAVILTSILIDLVFLAVWAFMHQRFEELVIHSLELQGLDWYSLAFFRVLFNGLTVYALLLYVVKDAIRIFHRIWDEQ
jgi:hypothetical protein